MKRFFAVVLSILLMASILTACGNSGKTQGTQSNGEGKESGQGNETKQEGEEPTKLVMYMAAAGNMEDAAKVAEKVNEYIKPLINAEISLNYINMGSYSEQVGLMIRSGEQIDVMFSFEGDTKNYIRQDALTPLNDLLEKYGSGIVEQIGEDNLKAAYVNGTVYSLPSLKDMAISRMFVYNKAMADAAGADFSNVKQINDLTDVFAKVKAKYTDKSMFGGAGGNAKNFEVWDWDVLSDSMGVLMNYGDSLKVENLYETDEYAQLCNLMRDWYEKGYIEKDFATSSETWTSRLQAGTAFGGITSYKPGAVEAVEAQTGIDCGYVILTEALSYTSSIVNTNWMIPASSVDPDKAMQFMDLMYTDPVVANLLLNGIEGTHYEENEDGTISRIDPDNNKYQEYLGWAYGNQFITKVWEGNALDIYEKTREFNASSLKSKALGFSFDNSAVVNEITACTNVANKYRTALECGAVNPEEILPKFTADLNAAGIEKIIKEKQAQLDAWAANNK
ncbi:MAG TPA: ABC transporter substrate-binding protein [Clostridiales bacterium]|nr:ABC transporter substrate-binding protein [Clostridiales bacterium]